MPETEATKAGGPRIAMGDGREIPLVGLGTYLAEDGAEAEASVAAALKLGYRHIDTAEGYENEASVGAAMAKSGVPRDEIFVCTKMFPGNPAWSVPSKTFEGTLACCRASVEKLGTDYVDLYLIHAPFCLPEERIEQYRALVKLQEDGLAKSIGVSNYAISHLEEIKAAGLPMPAVNQIEFHPLCTRPELIAYMRENNILPVAYSSLAPMSTWRTGQGSAKTEAQRENEENNGILAGIAAKYADKSEAQVLLRWAVQQGVPVLPKSTKPARIEANMDLFSFEIAQEDMDALSAMNQDLALAWPNGDPMATP
eukprot:CAMPEP_0118858428 /NCGR_PEP_ID=MMETSP1163-20130328/5107_1 /TAXON_ID=124430 /ORGANISM="Phaeomonas parva, Strain CCMP2877" /LENGTH=310 /DNA_ID=CAMNT_0006791879 /DNA_START=113 /DNA_END=1045 /DNA_ORIENTATION=+